MKITIFCFLIFVQAKKNSAIISVLFINCYYQINSKDVIGNDINKTTVTINVHR